MDSRVGEKGILRQAEAIVNRGCIRGGYPWRVSRTPDAPIFFWMFACRRRCRCRKSAAPSKQLFFDLREETSRLRHRVRDFRFRSRRAKSRRSRDWSRPSKPPTALMGKRAETRHRCGLVLDASVYDAFRHRNLNYGPSSGPRDAEGEKVAIETLVNTTKIYALDRRGNLRRAVGRSHTPSR